MADYESTLREAKGWDGNGKASDLVADFAELRKDFTKLSETVTTLVKHQADAAGTTMAGALETARGTISDTAAQASEKASSLASDLEATIERNPLTSVLIALSVGLVAGMMAHSRR